MNANEIIALLIGVLVAEGTEIAPWLAKKLVRWSAQIRHLDPKRAQIRAEELEAVIDSRPGKLFKLATALLFTAQAGGTLGFRLLTWIQLSCRIRRELDRPSAASPIASEIETRLVLHHTGGGKTESALHAAMTLKEMNLKFSRIVVVDELDPEDWIRRPDRTNRRLTG